MELRLAGIPVSDDDARLIVTTLVADDTPQAFDLANRITTCINLGTVNMTLDAGERSTPHSVLEDPPDPLVELRDALARDHRGRARD